MNNWIIIDGVKYDVSEFIFRHPGGPAIADFTKTDATDMFLSMHGPNSVAAKYLKTLPVISSDQISDQQTNAELSKDFQDIRKYAISLIHPLESWRAFSKEMLILLWFMGLSFTLIKSQYYYTSILSTALTFLHAGWFSHKIAHRQYADNVQLTTLICYLVGGVFGGYSLSWWHSKHNIMHHAHTNVINRDEDIDTLPFLKWDTKVKGTSLFVRFQHINIWLLLCFSRWMWLKYSISWAWDNDYPIEAIILTVHYALFLAPTIHYFGALPALLWFAMVTSLSGFLIGFVFLQSHNGESIMQEGAQETSPFKHTLLTTRNIKSNWFNDWFTGHLNYQIEHHLFPWLPSYLYKEIQPFVKYVCEKHHLKYKEYGWIESTHTIYKHLRTIAEEHSKNT